MFARLQPILPTAAILFLIFYFVFHALTGERGLLSTSQRNADLAAKTKELKKIPTVCGSLREALESLDKDRKFLTAGGVFDDDQIDAFIELKMAETMRYETTPHPVEYDMYYSC